jgi:hypothetical protein
VIGGVGVALPMGRPGPALVFSVVCSSVSVADVERKASEVTTASW